MRRRTHLIGLLARLVVGGVWVVAGAIKLPDPAGNVRSVRAYQLLPETVVPFVGHALPILEILVGACLLLGVLTRLSAVVSALMLTAFVIGIASVWARGLSIECGCFGGGGGVAGDPRPAYAVEIARDLGLLLLCAWLVRRPRTPVALDNVLLPDLGHVLAS
jgi:uncharacterized membrane protein YphA (DoxX/SURF4 family)